MGGGQIIKEIRKHCLMCRRQNMQTCSSAPGKITPVMLRLPSEHHSFVMLDVIPSIKCSMFAGHRTVRGTQRNTVHVLFGVCMSTKLVNLILLPNKAEADLAMGIMALTDKMGRSPQYLLTDRESGNSPLKASTQI